MIPFLLVLSFQTLFAFSIGKEGEPVKISETVWQKVVFDDHDVGFKALLPGKPRSGISNGNIYTHSSFGKAQFEVHCSMSSRYSAPPKEVLFINQVQESFKNSKIVSIKSDQPTVLYITQFSLDTKLVRLYCGRNQLHWVIAQDADPAMTQLFFESVRITR